MQTCSRMVSHRLKSLGVCWGAQMPALTSAFLTVCTPRHEDPPSEKYTVNDGAERRLATA